MSAQDEKAAEKRLQAGIDAFYDGRQPHNACRCPTAAESA